MKDFCLGLAIGGLMGWLHLIVRRYCAEWAIRVLPRCVASPLARVLGIMVAVFVLPSTLLLLVLPMRGIPARWEVFLAGWSLGVVCAWGLSRYLYPFRNRARRA